MILMLCFGGRNTSLVYSQVLQNTDFINDSVIEDGNVNQVEIIETNDDSMINAIINDPEHIAFVDGKIVYDGASEDVHCRYIPVTDWDVRVRPALLRAATATNLFNL